MVLFSTAVVGQYAAIAIGFCVMVCETFGWWLLLVWFLICPDLLRSAAFMMFGCCHRTIGSVPKTLHCRSLQWEFDVLERAWSLLSLFGRVGGQWICPCWRQFMRHKKRRVWIVFIFVYGLTRICLQSFTRRFLLQFGSVPHVGFARFYRCVFICKTFVFIPLLFYYCCNTFFGLIMWLLG